MIDKIIKEPSDCLDLLKHIRNKKQEHFLVIALDGQHKVIYRKCVAIGTVNRCQVHPRDVFRDAVKKNSVALIIAHNHPSGNTKPSSEDFTFTKAIKDGGDLLGINILDHIIVDSNGYFSFLEQGLFFVENKNSLRVAEV